jgi:2-oxoglutarate dehydrogenase complex dehydrogenase (E1) component-like enzyme
MHKRLQGIWNEKKKMAESGKNIDWSLGEALAYAPLIP